MATPQSQHISLCNHKSTVSGSQKRPSTRLPVTSKEPGESLPGTQPRPETQYSGKSRHGDIGRNVERDGASQNERNAHPSYGTTYSRAHTPRTPVSQTLHPDGTMLTPSPAPPSHPQYVAGPSPAAKTPSLFSGSTVSAYESPRSALRRKPSTIDQYAFRAKTDPDSIQEHQELVEIAHDTISDPFPGSIFGIAFPPTGANRQDGKRAPKSKRGSTTVVEPQPVRTLVSPQPSTTNTTTKSHPRGHEGGTIQQSKSRVPSQTAESVASRLPTRNAPTSKETLSSRSQKDIRSKPRGTDLLFNDVSISQKAETVPTVSAAYQTERPPQTATAQVIDHASRRTGLPSSPAAYRDLGLPKSRSKDATTATQIASNSARPVQIPPEFAHLNVDVPPVKPSADTTAPRRPSRDGTPSLMEYQGPSPIVHSNLPPIYTSYHKRTPSLETPVSVTSPASSSSRRLFGFSPRSSSRDASPRVDFAISPPPSARLFSCGGTGSAKDAQPPVDRKGSPMIGPGPSPSKSPRFGFLHRKPKEEQKRLEKPRREPRRGPAADSAESPELLRAQTAMAMPAKSPQLVDIPRSQPPTPQTSQPLSPHVPRLSPIGRIPRVISRRDRERKLPDQSFSRPFAKSQPRPAVKPPGSFYAEIRHLASPPGSQPTSSTTGPSELASAGPKDNTPTDPSSVSAFDAYMSKTPVDEFIAFSPRKNSELSYTSSSGIASVSSKHTYQYHLTGAHGEEDVWHEYNDLLDEVLPEKTPLSTGSSLGQPFQYADIESDIERRVPINKPLPSLPLKYDINLGGLNTKRANLADVHDSRPPAAYAQPIDIPGTPFSISEYVAGYGDRTSGMAGSSSRLSMPWAHRSSMQPVRANHPPSRRSHASTHSRSMSLPETPFQQPHSPSADDVRNPQMLSSVAGETADKSVEAALLKRDALMTSKWLSFGRVLFSPAQDEAESGSDAKILVVDGLGKGKQSVYNLLDYAN
ncbi:hypothetical protein M8818_006289 [Zalaria obscura]|uniref:Uncharacterized protein n=1 Tax=Zalaria obscura TaxID=2024903 RepID=A0ACC3S9B9_9PEZI